MVRVASGRSGRAVVVDSWCDDHGLDGLLPHLRDVVVDRVDRGGEGVSLGSGSPQGRSHAPSVLGASRAQADLSACAGLAL